MVEAYVIVVPFIFGIIFFFACLEISPDNKYVLEGICRGQGLEYKEVKDNVVVCQQPIIPIGKDVNSFDLITNTWKGK